MEGWNNIQRLSAAESAPLARGVETGTATSMVLAAEGSLCRKANDFPFFVEYIPDARKPSDMRQKRIVGAYRS